MNLPPYGLFASNYDNFFSDGPMDDWQLGKKAWTQRYNQLLELVRTEIWPTWNHKKQRWEGDADATKERMTRAELKLMVKQFQVSDILASSPKYGGSVEGRYRKTHDWHYRVEDSYSYVAGSPKSNDVSNVDLAGSAFVGGNFVCYAPSYNTERFHHFFYGRPTRKIHGLFDFKRDFMRPRPYQAAAILNVPAFRYRMAAHGTHTGTHPSMLSGHCVQGILLGCKVLEHWIDNGEDSKELRKRLAQYMVDFGDRRVFAGVHYPTDNLVSWIIALTLIPDCYRHSDDILAFATDAICHRSTVFQLIDKHYRHHKHLKGIYETTLRHVKSAAVHS